MINSKKDELIPALIDMGKHKRVGQTYTKQIEIESNCPVNFEYKIDVEEPHPDILVSPMIGDIWGLETTLIDVTYSPQSFTTAEAVIRIKTTEFDSEYRYVRIVGNALPAPRNQAVEQEEEQENMKKANDAEVTKKGKNRILLTSKKDMRPPSKSGARLDKIPGRDTATLNKNLKSLNQTNSNSIIDKGDFSDIP